MTVYLLEAYLPRSQSRELEGLAERLRETAESHSVRYLRTTYVPEDETCFHYVEAASASAARRFAEREELSVDRIVEARNVAVSTASNSKEER